MANTQWVNRSQPQTLFIATIVMYINAVFGLLFGGVLNFSGSIIWLILGLALILAPVGAALGIANEKKWGYWLGVILTGLTVLYIVAHFVATDIITLLFYVALLALLLHPMSRNYYRTWFR
jgi:glucose-6-phosphate-specific signal transduction histidine kinase